MNRQRLTLFILLILLVLAVIWSYANLPRQKTVSVLKYAPGQQVVQPKDKSAPASVAPASQDTGRTLRLDLLDRERSAFKGYRRNIFKPVFVDEVKAMKQKAAAVKPVQPIVLPQKPVPAQPVVQPGTTQRELARFTFLGFLKKDNHKTIFLTKDKDILLVKKGDAFGGRYEASSITDQALTILVKDTGEEIVIPLLENRPLSTAGK